MGKSLKELVKGDSKKDKDLSGLLKEFEESYIYRSIDWVDQSLRLTKYYPDSKIAQGVDFIKDFMFYANVLGILPTEKQEKYAKHLGYDNLKFTKYSLIWGFTVDAVRFAAAVTMPPPISIGLYIWGFAVFAEDCTRLSYTLIKKKPVGSIIYVELPYRVLKPIVKGVNLLFAKRKDKKSDDVINPEQGTDVKAKNLNSLNVNLV